MQNGILLCLVSLAKSHLTETLNLLKLQPRRLGLPRDNDDSVDLHQMVLERLANVVNQSAMHLERK